MVMLGTKWPSITSTWTSVAPPRSAASISAPRRAKSADKIEGAISTTGSLSESLTSSRGTAPQHQLGRRPPLPLALRVEFELRAPAALPFKPPEFWLLAFAFEFEFAFLFVFVLRRGRFTFSLATAAAVS